LGERVVFPVKLAIIAGGKGTRLGLKDTLKPMVRIGEAPLLEHQINNAKRYGIKDIYILSGYLADVIENYFGDGKAFGVNIDHIIERHPLGTAGAVKQLEGKINERFMVFYGDVMLDVDLNSFMGFDKLSTSAATIIVHPNDHPYDSDLVEINNENIVTAFHPKPHKENVYYSNLVNAAVYILSPEIFKYIPHDKPSDFGKDIFPLLLKSGETIRAYRTAEYLKDMGTPDRLKKIKDDFAAGKISRLSKKNKRPAIFMDRDGTLVEDIDLLHKVEDLKLFPFSSSAIKKINDSDFIAFLITNQPVVARNLCDVSVVTQIHSKLEGLLGMEGAYLNDIYFCPHHPDKGYPEENPNLKIDCECRKPKTGMISRALSEYNIDAGNSWFIGDATVDIQTGINAGMKTVLVRTGKDGQDKKFEVSPDLVFDNLADAVDFILSKTH
jgi:histidinol-phosphate phosphatase family protein